MHTLKNLELMHKIYKFISLFINVITICCVYLLLTCVRTWSASEVRTVIINIYELPLKVEFIDEFYTMLFTCCNSSDNSCAGVQNNVNISQYYYRGLHSEQKQVIER